MKNTKNFAFTNIISRHNSKNQLLIKNRSININKILQMKQWIQVANYKTYTTLNIKKIGSTITIKNISRLYSTNNVSSTLLNIINPLSNPKLENNKQTFKNNLGPGGELKPNYISGLTQADGSFNCGITVTKSNNNLNLRFRPKFEIVLDKDSKDVLIAIQHFFNCGTISKENKDGSVNYVVSNLIDLKNIIIPHFLNYPVLFNKLHAFQLLCKIVKLMEFKHQLRDKVEILRLAISMNVVSRRTKEHINYLYSILGIASDKILPNISDNINTITSEITPEFIAGMIDGDGSFYIIFTKELNVLPAMKQCYGKNCSLFEPYFKKYFGNIGQIEEKANLRIWTLRNLNLFINNVIPFMDANPIHTAKKDHYLIWKEVCLILNTESKLSQQSLIKLVNLAYNMNKEGKRRKITKDKYLELIDKHFN